MSAHRSAASTNPSRRRRPSSRSVLCLAIALALVVAACGSDSDGGERGSDDGGSTEEGGRGLEEITIAVADFGGDQLDPVMGPRSAVTELLLPMYDTLLEIGPDSELAPGIAEEWETSEDGLTWTFHLRHGVQFHGDYGELTADDVKFSLERWMNENAAASESATLQRKISEVRVVDDYTVEVVTDGVQSDLPFYLSPHQTNSGIIFSEKHLTEAAGDDFEAQTEVLNEHPIGSGPFQFVSRQRGVSLVYEAVEEHWRTTPAVKRVEFRAVPEAATRLAMLQTGEIDISGVSGDEVAQVEAAGLDVRTVPAGQTIDLEFTGIYRPAAEGKPPAEDVRVRQALSMVIDREQLLETLLGGYGSLITTPWNTTPATQDIDEEHYAEWAEENNRFDPEAARELLADAGYPDGFDGFQMFLYVRPGADYLPEVGEAIVSIWEQELNVRAEIVSTDYATYRQHAVGADIDDPVAAGDSTVIAVAPRFDAIGALNGFWSFEGNVRQLLNDPELDALIAEAAATSDDAERQSLVEDTFDIALEESVAMPLFHADSVYGVNPEVGEWHSFPAWPWWGRMLETVGAG